MEAPTRVVVTGMGVVAPNGIGLEAFWESLLTGRSGIGPISHFDATDFPVKIAGEVRGLDVRDYFPEAKPHRMSRQTQLAVVASKMAVEHAGLTPELLKRLEPLRMVLGISSSAADVIEAAKATIMTKGPRRVRLMVGASQPSATAANIIEHLQIQASITTVSNACPSGLDALEIAAKEIQAGRADCILVGGTDSPLNTTGVAGFTRTGTVATTTDVPPGAVCRPFDVTRNGVVLAEAAGFLVLERLDAALARGATPYAEIVGAVSISDPPGGEPMDGLLQTMDLVMKNASVYPDQIGYICANALSLPTSDAREVRLIEKLFGPLAARIPVSSIRGVMGHPLAPAGILQTMACILAMRHQLIPPTANLTQPDPEWHLDLVMKEPRRAAVRLALVNTHGVCGENTSLLVRSYP